MEITGLVPHINYYINTQHLKSFTSSSVQACQCCEY